MQFDLVEGLSQPASELHPLSLSDLWYWLILMAVVSYFIGCFSTAALIAKARHKDVHKIGSGNPGTMNISREFGLKVGFLNFVVDFCKGGLPALASYFIFRGYVFEGTDVPVSDFTRFLCGVFVVAGHIWPVTMKFKGGKGIASSLGLCCFSLACDSPWNILITLGVLLFVLLFIAITECGSMGSLLGVSALSVWQGVIFYLHFETDLLNGWAIASLLSLAVLNFLTWFAHRKNLVRLFAGEEHHTSVKKLSKGKRGTQNM